MMRARSRNAREDFLEEPARHRPACQDRACSGRTRGRTSTSSAPPRSTVRSDFSAFRTWLRALRSMRSHSPVSQRQPHRDLVLLARQVLELPPDVPQLHVPAAARCRQPRRLVDQRSRPHPASRRQHAAVVHERQRRHACGRTAGCGSRRAAARPRRRRRRSARSDSGTRARTRARRRCARPTRDTRSRPAVTATKASHAAASRAVESWTLLPWLLVLAPQQPVVLHQEEAADHQRVDRGRVHGPHGVARRSTPSARRGRPGSISIRPGVPVAA